MTGGLAFEGLNNVASQPNNLLIILNDNHISIDPITGGLSKYLVDLTTNKLYNTVRDKGYQGLKKLNLINETRKQNIQRVHNSLKGLINGEQPNIFEGFSIRYFGPVDGHNVLDLIERLNILKDFQGPKLLHLKTEKGKGFKPAEENAVVWHSPGVFDRTTGERIQVAKQPDEPEKFQDVFGKTLLELAQLDDRIVGVTPAMVSGSSFGEMMKAYPDRVFDVGIAEGHAATYSAGLAMGGMIPFCCIYSSFMQRAYDEVIHDIAMQQAPVILCLDRAGLVGEDGVTHHGLYDIPSLRTIPGLTLMSPYDEEELRQMMYTAYKQVGKIGPIAIRYPRGKGSNGHWRTDFEELPIGKAQVLRKGERVCVITYGPIGNNAKQALDLLEAEGFSAGHINLRFVNPLDQELLQTIATKYDHIVTIENGSLAGGMGSAILEYYSDLGTDIHIHRMGVGNQFVRHGSVSLQESYVGIDPESIANKVRKLYSEANI